MREDTNKDHPIRVLVVDDHPALRDGVGAMIRYEPDMVVAGEAACGRSAVDAYARIKPDVTLMDLRMPDMGGTEAIRQIRKDNPEARIVALTTYKGDMHARLALAAGAVGYLLKSVIREELIMTLRAAHMGQRRIAPAVAAGMAVHYSDDILTSRELDVLKAVSEGTGNKKIGDYLGISAGTVKDHVSHVLSKLGAYNRAHAVTIAIKRGILPNDE